MAVGSGWVGSSAVTETGQRWMSAARTALRLSTAGWMSEMVGKSKEFVINVTANDNYDRDTLVNAMSAACGGNWTNAAFRINVSGRVTCPYSKSSVFWFGGAMTAVSYVHIVNSGWIVGRGGNGTIASGGRSGDGRHAIENYIGTKLRIENNGIIAGGGGGGGGSSNASGGGGGRPLGAGTSNAQRSNGAPGTWDAGGAGGSYGTGRGGAGGDFGQAGGAPVLSSGSVGSTQGNSGYAVYGQTPTYVKAGDIRGPKV